MPTKKTPKKTPKKKTTGDEAAKVLARVQALLARAGDPGASEEEQRTSAAIAARLIREHQIPIGAPAPAAPPATATVVRSSSMTPEQVQQTLANVREAFGASRALADSLAVLFGRRS